MKPSLVYTAKAVALGLLFVTGLTVMHLVVSHLATTSLVDTPSGKLSAVSFGLAALSAVFVAADLLQDRWEAYLERSQEQDGLSA